MTGYGGGSYGGGAYGGVGVPLLPGVVDGALAVEVAWGANLTADPTTWTWTDVTADVRVQPGISTSLGRADEASVSQPATCTLTLDNSAAHYSLGGHSPNWPNVRRGTPVRVRVAPGDGSGYRVMFQGFADGFTPGWDSRKGTIPVARLSASGVLRRLGQWSAPVPSALRRAMEKTASVVAYWPMEVGEDATLAPAVRGGTPMYFGGIPNFRADSSFACSEPLPKLGSAQFHCRVDPYFSGSSEHQIRWLMTFPPDGIPDGTVLAYIYTAGGLSRWDITYETYDAGAKGGIGVFRYDADGTFNSSNVAITFDVNGTARRWSLDMTQVGADIDWTIGQVSETATAGTFFSGTIAGRTAGVIERVVIAPFGDVGDVGFGHVTIQNEVTSLYEADGPLAAYRGETPTGSGRFLRLAEENNLAVDVTGTSESLGVYDDMGPQLPVGLLELLRECETADQGQLYDGRAESLSYTTRRYRETGTVALTIAADQLAGAFDPVDDDQRTRNRVEARRVRGTSATFEDIDGPMGTETIGIYDSSIEVNNLHDSMAVQYAGWLVNLGTVPGYRYPSVAVDLRATPGLAGAVLDLIPGDRIKVTDLDGVFASTAVGDADLIVEGITHEISPQTWLVTFQCSPFYPWSVGLAAATTGDTGEFVQRMDTTLSTVAATAAQGATSLSVAAHLTEGFEDATLEFSFSGDWARTNVTSNGGVWSFGSAAITHSQTSTTSVVVPEGATAMYFDYRVSSEAGFDFFVVIVDGLGVLTTSGLGSWVTNAGPFAVSGGSSVIFGFTKDSAVDGGLDGAFIDNLRFERGPLWTTTADDYPLSLDVGGLEVVATACSGATAPQTFTVQALPAQRAAGLPVRLWNPRPLGL